MNYLMKSGCLCQGEDSLVYLKGNFIGSEKKIYSADGTLLLRTDIRNLETPPSETGSVLFRRYVMLDAAGNLRAEAAPAYASADDPALHGWPICRLPRADHAQLQCDGQVYTLCMQDSKNYCLAEKSREPLLQIHHRGFSGGWDIETVDAFSPEFVCGIFIFCRYLEQENEFLTV